jgi:hypothetical protein
MGCCGDRRNAFRAARPPSVAVPPANVSRGGGGPPGSVTRVEHVGRTSVRVRGPVSGRVYTFTPSRRVQQVDPADLPVLLRSRLFRPVR